MTLAGTIKSGGSITLEYLSLPPVVAGATLVPPTTPQKNETLNACPVAVPDQAVCGNGTIECAEACDDQQHDRRRRLPPTTARVENVCGDGRVDSRRDSAIDDRIRAAAAPRAATFEACGNGMLECGEGCDDGNQIAGDGCEACRVIPAGCGDGDKTGLEECDDGNTTDGDGCSHECRDRGAAATAPSIAGEDCDDRNHTLRRLRARLQVRGLRQRRLDCGEECDDGADNGKPGGSCLPEVCQPGPTCSTATTEACIPCAGSTDCDPMDACGPVGCMDGVCTRGRAAVCDDQRPVQRHRDRAIRRPAASRARAPACSGDRCVQGRTAARTRPVASPMTCPATISRNAASESPPASSRTPPPVDISSKMKSKLTKKLDRLEGRVARRRAGQRQREEGQEGAQGRRQAAQGRHQARDEAARQEDRARRSADAHAGAALPAPAGPDRAHALTAGVAIERSLDYWRRPPVDRPWEDDR